MEVQLNAETSVKGGSLGKTVHIGIQLHAQMDFEMLHAIRC